MDFFIESQVKTFATFGDFPATGQVKTIYIDEATSNQYYWNGLSYVGLSDSNKVPYTGATGNVDLGEYQIKAGQVELDQTPTGTFGVGKMRWNDTDGTAEIRLKGDNVTLQIGQEQVKRVVNKTSPLITLQESAYQAVVVSGAQGQRLSVKLAKGDSDANSAGTIGIVTETIAANQEGFITTSGEVRNINTTGSLQGETWADGDILYLSPTTFGALTNIKPVAPNHLVVVGYVEYAHGTQGKIFVKVDNGYELEELHNVTDTNYTTPQDEDSFLFFDETQTIWKRLRLDTLISTLSNSFQSALGFTPENVANKSTSVTTDQASNTKYPSVKSVYDWATGLFATIAQLATKQNTLVSGTNIKTINGSSVLGSGDLTVASSASWGGITGTLSDQTDLNTALNARVNKTTTININGIAKDLSAASVIWPGINKVIGIISTPQTAVTGTTNDTRTASIYIAPNTFSGGSTLNYALEIQARIVKTGINGTHRLNIYLNTIDSLTGATYISSHSVPGTGNIYIQQHRNFSWYNNILSGILTTGTNYTDNISTTSSLTNATLTSNVGYYLIFSIQLGSTLDSSVLNYAKAIVYGY